MLPIFFSFTVSGMVQTFNHCIPEKKKIDAFKKTIWLDSFAFKNSGSEIELHILGN